MEESARFILCFISMTGAKDKYEIPRANTEMTEEDISIAMNSMIQNGCFATTNGIPMEAESAELVETSVTDLM